MSAFAAHSLEADLALKAQARRRKMIAGFGFFVLVVTSTIAVVYPFYWMVMASFTPEGYSLTNAPLLLPDRFSVEAYQSVFAERPLMTWLGNTIAVTLGGTAIVLPAALLASYGLNRFRFRGRMVFIFLVLLCQLLPASALIVPIFLIFRDYKLIDTTLGVTIAFTTFMLPMAIWVLWGYIQTIPHEFEEAAMVDGCNGLQAFIRVTLPLAMPGIAATALFIFLEGWNHYLLAFVLTSDTQQWVISLGLYSFIGQYVIEIEQMMATSVIAAFPALVVFAIMQRYLRGGLSLGGLKG
ncbi:MAG: putative sugar ABC transporter permease [Chloroflexi bacterium OLB13]|nr:MAG: putative sugar ABC transporter permease [Chloroflexi bacterium OLB13]